MNNNEKQTNLLKKIKDFCQSSSGKMTLFFGFYFFFFLFLILSFNSSDINDDNKNNNDSNNTNVVEENKDSWQIKSLINDNYLYSYYIMEDGNSIIFNGKVNEENSLIEEYRYNYFLNLYNINQIVKNSKYIAKDILVDGYQYNYEITNKDLSELLKNDQELSNEMINKITIYTNSDLIVTKIDFDLSFYMQELNNYNNYQITLQYEKSVN